MYVQGDVDSALKAIGSGIATLSSLRVDCIVWCPQSEVRSFCAEDDFCEVLSVGVDWYYNEIHIKLHAHGHQDLTALCLASVLRVNEEELRHPTAGFSMVGPSELHSELTFALPATSPGLDKLSFSFGASGFESAELLVIGGSDKFDVDKRGPGISVEGTMAEAKVPGYSRQSVFTTRCFDLTKRCEACNYFEVEVLELEDGFVGVGLASPDFTASGGEHEKDSDNRIQ